MPDKPVPDNDPIVTKSYAAHYMIAVTLLTASLLWALWDEAFGMRPWKAYQHEWKQRYTAFLKSASSKSDVSQKEVEGSSDYQKLKQDLDQATQQATPHVRDLQKQIGDLSAKILAVQSVFTDRRAYVNALTYQIETNPSSKQSIQKDLDKYKAQTATVEYPDGSKQPYNFEQLEETYNSLKDQRAKLNAELGDTLKPVTQAKAALDEYVNDHMSAASQSWNLPSRAVAMMARDYAELTKMRVTMLVVLTAWCGYYFGCLKAGIPSLSWGLFHALLGIGFISGGTAALNEVMEHDIDGRMRRTAQRPLPTGRMSILHATLVGMAMTVGGALYLDVTLNTLTGTLALVTAFVYLAAYTPLKKVHPVCTFVGAFPGAMPGVLGWTAVRGRLEWEAVALFAIVFFWQFPHFFSIAWLYRDDYAAGQIRMLPVVEPDGKSTARRILIYSLLLIPVSLTPTFLGMSGRAYLIGALLLGAALLYVGGRLITLRAPLSAPRSKQRARQLLQATVLYLPLLFVLMMLSRISS